MIRPTLYLHMSKTFLSDYLSTLISPFRNRLGLELSLTFLVLSITTDITVGEVGCCTPLIVEG